MIGSIIGAGLSAIGGIAGGISASKTMKKVQASIDKRKEENQDWYDRRYNEDPTQRASAQRAITMVSDSIKQRNQAAAGTKAIMGGTDESVALAKEQNNKALADTTSQIAAQGDARKDEIEQRYMAQKDGLAQQEEQMLINKAQGTASAMQGVSGAASDISSLLDDYGHKK